MVSTLHELLVELSRTVAGSLLSTSIPNLGSRTWWEANAVMNLPTPVERCADLVLLDAPERPSCGVIVEVQLRWDAEKLYTMPYYHLAARDRHRCPIHVLVVTPDALVASRLSRPVDIGSGVLWRPAVFGPVEAWTYTTTAPPEALSPELVLLLAGIAGEFDDGRLAQALFEVATAVDSAIAPDYLEVAVNALNNVSGQLFKELLMNTKTTSDLRTHKNPLAQAYMEVGREEGREEARTALLELIALTCTPATYATLSKIEDLAELRGAVTRAIVDSRR